ncbi:MAG: trigger factor family protein, partial [Firmicutes bacterium]|nr:trigger factor family protein [Bacillota bacterium]
MKTTLSERDGNTVKLEVEVSSEELQTAFDERTRQLARELRLPGFRPGKVPVLMARRRLGDEAILADTIEEYMSRWFAQAARELDLDPVDRPQVEIKSDGPELGKPLVFEATVTVMPEVVLGEYKGLEVVQEPVEV